MEEGDVLKDVTHVRIDSSVRAITERIFSFHGQLRIVILIDELEEIGQWAIWMVHINGRDQHTQQCQGN